MKLAKGLKIIEETIGTGPEAKKNDIVHVSCSCLFKNGNILFSTKTLGLFQIRLGYRETYVALEQGLVGMRKGGCRKIKVPPNLAYYERNLYPELSEKAVLYYDVLLVEIADIFDNTLHIRTSPIYSKSTKELEEYFRTLTPSTELVSEYQIIQRKMFSQADKEYQYYISESKTNNIV